MERAGPLLRKLKNCATSEELARAAWSHAVGKTIAAHSSVMMIVRSRLVVAVEDPEWQRQLHSLRGQVLVGLEKVIGPGVVDDIEFRLIVQRRQPQREETPRVAEAAGDEADSIRYPAFRRLYKAGRKRASV